MNGQEKDDEISGILGAHTTAMYWEYDTRLGRRWNLDPKPNSSINQYATFANNSIGYSDIKGDTVAGETQAEQAYEAEANKKDED
ncbi:hypothetical protein KFE94_07190 [bacterium SCSIO 12643]|nr:hypothetical protein KFE94_07190 [bacterium SCSIO 12643]